MPPFAIAAPGPERRTACQRALGRRLSPGGESRGKRHITMALNCYLRLKGQKQGEIKGSVTQKGRENSIMVIAVSHAIVSPRDSASGLPTGKRMHKPFVITKELDKSSPLLYNCLVNNENIPEWELQFWTPQLSAATGSGAEKQHYTVKLINAN